MSNRVVFKTPTLMNFAYRYDTPAPAVRTWVDAIESGSRDDAWEIVDAHREDVIDLLRGGK